MYHDANSRIDHVTNRAIGVKMREYWSNLKLMLMSKLAVFIQCQLVTMLSVP